MIRSDEELTLETSAFESLYGGQLTLSTQLVKTNYPNKTFDHMMRKKIADSHTGSRYRAAGVKTRDNPNRLTIWHTSEKIAAILIPSSL